MREMTAADLCDECGLPSPHEDGKNIGYLFYPPRCPNCTHQTPAERVVEAARAYQRRPGARTEAALFEALADLDGGGGPLLQIERQGPSPAAHDLDGGDHG